MPVPIYEGATPDPYNWRDHAKCKGMDVNIFFQDPGEQCAEAKVVCRTCPVKDDCLEDALEEEKQRLPYGRLGVRGGMTPAERYDLWAERQGMARPRRRRLR